MLIVLISIKLRLNFSSNDHSNDRSEPICVDEFLSIENQLFEFVNNLSKLSQSFI
jgi:hypothetical protein